MTFAPHLPHSPRSSRGKAPQASTSTVDDVARIARESKASKTFGRFQVLLENDRDVAERVALAWNEVMHRGKAEVVLPEDVNGGVKAEAKAKAEG